MKVKTIKFLRKDLLKFKDEIVIDIWSILGSYCGTFVCGKETYKMLKQVNKSSKGSNYFTPRKEQI